MKTKPNRSLKPWWHLKKKFTKGHPKISWLYAFNHLKRAVDNTLQHLSNEREGSSYICWIPCNNHSLQFKSSIFNHDRVWHQIFAGPYFVPISCPLVFIMFLQNWGLSPKVMFNTLYSCTNNSMIYTPKNFLVPIDDLIYRWHINNWEYRRWDLPSNFVVEMVVHQINYWHFINLIG